MLTGKTCFTAFLIFICCTIISQPFHNYKIDSLQRVIEASLNDTCKINACILLSKEYGTLNPDTAMHYGKQALMLSQKNNYTKGIAKSYWEIGKIYSLHGNNRQALEFYFKSLHANFTLGSLEGISECFVSIGNTYLKQGKYLYSLIYFQRALKIDEFLKDYVGVSICYNNIGIIYYYQKNYDLALKYYKEALNISIAHNDKDGYLSFINVGNIYLESGKYPLALKYFKEALKYSSINENKVAFSDCLGSIGNIYIELGKYSDAKEYLNKSLKVKKELDDKLGVCVCLEALSGLNFKLGNYEDAIQIALQSLKVAEEINALQQIKGINRVLIDSYARLNDYKNAFFYQEYFTDINDSIYNLNSARQLKEIEAKYQNEKKEKENQILLQANQLKDIKLKRRNVIIYSVFLCSIISLIFLCIIFYNYRQKKKAYRLLSNQNQVLASQKDLIENQQQELKKEKIISDNILLKILPESVIEEIKTNGKITYMHYEMLADLFSRLQNEKMHSQFEALKNQVNPHFLFNSLNVLSALVHINPDLSEQFIYKLANAYRYVLEQKDKELIMLSTEIDFLRSFAFLMKIRFSDKIITEINIDEEKQRLFIPPLTLQILVENAVKHNIISKDNPLIIELFTDVEGNLVVRNNYCPQQDVGTSSTGIGLQNIVNRYKFYTERPVEYGVNDNFFVVKIPLIDIAEIHNE